MAATFTIAIPARDGMPFVREALASALAQTRPADEVLLVDDASTDGTLAHALELERAGRIRVHRNARPTGFADAWNRAASLARGEFVSILHQDDLLHPDHLARMERAFARYPGVGHGYAACDYIDALGRVVRRPDGRLAAEPQVLAGAEYARRYLRAAAANRHIHRCPGVTTRRDILTGPCPYRAEAGMLADDDFFIRVGAYTDVLGIAEPLASYREHAASASGRLESMTLQLATDYLFQLGRCGGEGILEREEIDLMRTQAIRFVNRLLVEGVRQRRTEWVARARELRGELEALHPGLAGRALPAWARPLWALAGTGGLGRGARLYVQAVDAAVRARDTARGASRR